MNTSATDNPPIASATPRLPLAHYRVRFRAQQTVRLPPYSGSTWRGAFGHALRAAACATGAATCSGCLLYASCVYPYLFETAPPPDSVKMRRYNRVPHPFVLRPLPAEQARASGTRQTLLLTVFGHANRALPYFFHALEQAAHNGIGAGRTPMTLMGVDQRPQPGSGEWEIIHEPQAPLQPLPPAEPAVPALPPGLVVELLTPLRLQSGGRQVGAADFTFADLFANLLRRVSMLTHFHTDTPLETDFAGLIRQARDVGWTQTRVHWHDWARYSSRQKTHVPMGGLMGQVALSADALAPFWPYLWLGQWCHAGKGTSMGLGAYRLAFDKLAEQTPDEGCG